MTQTPTAKPAGLLDDVRVQSEVFDGPIDLLLTLAQRQQVDLNRVRLGDLAWGYLQSLSADDGSRARTPEAMAAFLVVASRLLALKAAALLPGAAGDDEEEDLEAWEETVRQRMLEYQRFKDAATELMRRHQEGGFSFPSAVEGEIIPSERLEIDPDGLAAAFQAILDRLPAPTEVQVELSSYSLTDEMDRIRTRITGGPATSFTVLFDAAESRMHAVVIFLALLEMVRLGEARFRQRSTFGEIEILRRSGEATAGGGDSAPAANAGDATPDDGTDDGSEDA